MIKYKHKQTGIVVSEPIEKDNYYYTTDYASIHKGFIENTNDWELVVEKVTGWYVNPNFPKWLMYRDNDKRYGIDSNGDWTCVDNYAAFDESDTPATTEITLKMLSEYATKLGYKDGVKIESLIDNRKEYLIKNSTYALVNNKLWLADICIMKDGIWAKIVNQSSFTPEQLAELKELINNK